MSFVMVKILRCLSHCTCGRYRALPLNAFERVHLLNSVLITRWLYDTMFIPHDRMFHHIDKTCLEFVN